MFSTLEDSINRQAILKTQENNDKYNSLIQYVTTFNPHNTEIYPDFFLKKKSLLLRENIFTSIYKNIQFLNSKRQPQSLEKLFTKAKKKTYQELQNAKSPDVDYASTLEKNVHTFSVVKSLM